MYFGHLITEEDSKAVLEKMKVIKKSSSSDRRLNHNFAQKEKELE